MIFLNPTCQSWPQMSPFSQNHDISAKLIFFPRAQVLIEKFSMDQVLGNTCTSIIGTHKVMIFANLVHLRPIFASWVQKNGHYGYPQYGQSLFWDNWGGNFGENWFKGPKQLQNLNWKIWEKNQFHTNIMILANWAHLRPSLASWVKKWSLWAYLTTQVPCKCTNGGPLHGQSSSFGGILGQFW